jgi:Domain of unknown function (DUF4352)
MKKSQKGSVTVAILILIVGCAVAFYFYNKPRQPVSKPVEQQKTKLAIPKPQNAAEVSGTVLGKIGTPFTLWNVEYKVISATNFKPTYDFQKTTGKYIGVKIDITNVGKSELSVNKIYITDSAGRHYEMDMLGYHQLSVADYGEEKVKPGITKTFGAIFEVAKDSTGLKLEYPSAQGSVAASVDLGI